MASISSWLCPEAKKLIVAPRTLCKATHIATKRSVVLFFYFFAAVVGLDINPGRLQIKLTCQLAQAVTQDLGCSAAAGGQEVGTQADQHKVTMNDQTGVG